MENPAFATGIHNTSEIGRLRKVMLHRPGKELENLMPEYLERLLFDDIPYLKVAQEEHDAFADCLRKCGVEVLYLRDLVAQSMVNDSVREELVESFLDEAGLEGHRIFVGASSEQHSNTSLHEKAISFVSGRLILPETI